MLRIVLGGGLASIHMDDLSTTVVVILIISATLVIGLVHRFFISSSPRSICSGLS